MLNVEPVLTEKHCLQHLVIGSVKLEQLFLSKFQIVST